MGFLTLDKIARLGQQLDAIEKHLVDLELKIDTINKENNSIKNIESNIAEIKNQISELKKQSSL